MVERVTEISGGPADLVLNTAIAATFPLGEWKSALEISQAGHARGKLLLLPGAPGTEIR